MKNFHFLLSAWIAAWAVFFVYELSVASRLSQLRGEIDRLKHQMKE